MKTTRIWGKVVQASYHNHVEGLCHHGYQHVEEQNSGSQIIQPKQYSAKGLDVF